MDYMRVLMRCMLVSAMRVPPVFVAGVHVLGAALGDGYAIEEVPFSSPVACDSHAYVLWATWECSCI